MRNISTCLSKWIIYLSCVLLILVFSCKSNNNSGNNDSNIVSDSVFLSSLGQNYYSAAFSQKNNDSQLNVILDTISSYPGSSYKYLLEPMSNLVFQQAQAGNISFSDSLSKIVVKLAQKSKDSSLYAACLQDRGLVFWIGGQLDSARQYFQTTKDIAIHTNNIEQIISSRLNLALINQHQVSFEKTVKELEKLIDLSEKNEKWGFMASACNNIGNLYGQSGQTLTALNYYKKASELYKNIGDKMNYLNPLLNQAIIYKDLGMDSMAIRKYEQVKEVAHEENNYNIYHLCMINMGSIYLTQNNTKKAFTEIQNALNFLIEEELPVSKNHIVNYSLLGSVYEQQGKKDSAKFYFHKAIHLARELKYESEIASPGKSLINIYYKEQQPDSILILSRQYLPVAEKFEMKKLEADMNFYLAEANAFFKDYNTATSHYEAAFSLNQDLLKEISSQTVKDIVYYKELQEKERKKRELQEDNRLKEIMVKNRESTIRLQKYVIALAIFFLLLLVILIYVFVTQTKRQKKFNKTLQEDNDFKSNLFSIVSHDVRSPLVSIYSMFNMLEEGELDEGVKTRIQKDLMEKTEKTIDLVENLLFWTKGQLKEAKVNLEETKPFSIVNDILFNEFGDRASDHFNIQNNIPEELNIIADKNILRLVFRNLISNSMKFTPENGTITIDYHEVDNEYRFSVSDNGVGIKAEDHEKLLKEDVVSTKGISGQKGKGFGLNLCKYFLSKCDGNIWFESEKDKGTTFFFSFPNDLDI